ncbi:SPOR domain-containing protein [Tenacibaculum singaporense]|uniref:SPOR domain-containing protein n=1 Tax=Tenacibaculum singaporense TaxID=2358479 RepID=A0A3Q8RSN4_9FLAO|nr:SPOR domain-containing protein [Tenacibaculum singaporense]AZJ35823.1 SPOR domain-containing protein [Tenacibaculum singaporense]
MPFIEEEKFKLMQEDLDNAKLKREEAESELSSTQEELVALKKSSKTLPIFLGLLLGLALGAAYYFYANGGSSAINNIDIEAVKKKEAYRVLDSISRAQARAARNADESENNVSSNSNINTEAVADEIAENTSGQTIYSVQIGVLSENKYPLLSSEVIPSTVTTDDGYFKYSLGLYTTLDEAKDLQKELIKIGFSDAFVASYINGKRQKIHN